MPQTSTFHCIDLIAAMWPWKKNEKQKMMIACLCCIALCTKHVVALLLALPFQEPASPVNSMSHLLRFRCCTGRFRRKDYEPVALSERKRCRYDYSVGRHVQRLWGLLMSKLLRWWQVHLVQILHKRRLPVLVWHKPRSIYGWSYSHWEL